ncbi:hypothetical protein C8F04DRAFT_961055 [Mycena alexandri]|uniref:CxC6 like cysteine cluster associated with KDZ domain-containing protein n=1 Tax=Mycena alexandri TaxID=1745969 RepID=A0AAD6SQX1_9AGAR|nr:hypothetical protein C8F04DRAFT_961055 [Mycena alexandri]
MSEKQTTFFTKNSTCCGEFRCTEPVQSKRGRRHFCEKHDHLHAVCAIVSCNNPVVAGSRACSLPAHQEMYGCKFRRVHRTKACNNLRDIEPPRPPF